jgi:hypothetical protein
VSKWVVGCGETARESRTQSSDDSAYQLQPIERAIEQWMGRSCTSIDPFVAAAKVGAGDPLLQSAKVDADGGMSVRPAVVIRRPATAQVSDTLEDGPGLGVPAAMKIARTSIDQQLGAMGGAGYLLV